MKTSVIITCFNVERHIATAIRSVIDARLEDCEIIVVDDGSTDMTRAIITRIARMNLRDTQLVPVFFSGNTKGGVGSAANIGLDLARGQTILFVDGDDWVNPPDLRAAVQHLASSTSDFLVTDATEYNNQTGARTKYPEGDLWQALLNETDAQARKRLLLRMAPMPWRKIYRRDFLERNRIRFPVGDFYFEDNPFHWQVTTRAEDFDVLPVETHIHRLHRAGQTIAHAGGGFLKIFEHFDIIHADLGARDQLAPYRDELAAWLVRHVIWCGDRIPPGWLNDVFDNARDRLALFSDDTLRAAMRQGNLSPRDMRRLTAILLGRRLDYLREF